METLPIKPETLDIAVVQDIIGQAPAILKSNQTSTQKACEFADNLIQNKNEVGMSDNLDVQMAAFVEKGNKTIKYINEQRKPFTQMVDMLKKEFTGLESTLKAKVDEVQKIRNDYATEKMNIQREIERQAALKLARENEIIELKKTLEIQYVNYLINRHSTKKRMLHENFNAFSLATIGNATQWLREQWNGGCEFEIPKLQIPYLQYVENETAQQILDNVLFADYSAKMNELTADFKTECEILAKKVESKKAELQALEQANAAEKERLQKEQADREKAEKERLELEAKAAAEKAEAEAALKAAGEQAAAMVDNAVEVAAEKSQVKEGYEIILKNVTANLLLVNFWFEKEGKTLSQDKIDKVTFARMRAFCENYALKTGEIIVSPLIEYKEIYKAK